MRNLTINAYLNMVSSMNADYVQVVTTSGKVITFPDDTLPVVLRGGDIVSTCLRYRYQETRLWDVRLSPRKLKLARARVQRWHPDWCAYVGTY